MGLCEGLNSTVCFWDNVFNKMKANIIDKKNHKT